MISLVSYLSLSLSVLSSYWSEIITTKGIIIIIIIFVTTFKQAIYSYIPVTKHVSRLYSVAAVLYLQFVLHVMLFRMLNMFCTFTLALSAVCAQCKIWLVSVVT